MTSTEDRIRAATRAAAGLVREVRPLDLPADPAWRLPGRRLRDRGRSWLIPLSAAAAVIAIALGLIALQQIRNGSSPRAFPPAGQAGITPACGGKSTPAPSAAGAAPTVPRDVPRYFAQLCGVRLGAASSHLRLIVADTRSGAVLGSFPAPSGKYQVTGIYGTAGNRAFFVSAFYPTSRGPRIAWWALHLTPGTARPVSMTQLPWTLAGEPLSSTVSPDGTRVAASFAGDPGPDLVRIYSLATGAVLRTWTASRIGDLHWTGDGRGLAYQRNSVSFAVRDIAAPGSALTDHSTPLLSLAAGAGQRTSCGGASNWAVSANGTTIVCPRNDGNENPGAVPSGGSQGSPPGGCLASGPGHQLAFLRFAAGAHLPGTPPVGADYSVSTCASVDDIVFLLWASPDGTEVIGLVSYPGHNEVGVFRDGTFTPLPFLLPSLGSGSDAPEGLSEAEALNLSRIAW